ncbi:3865_t:CDS:2, partial [Gigaspora rosea]
EIQRPLLKLIKNKAELQITTSTHFLKHGGFGNCRMLDEELFMKQVLRDINNIRKIWKFNIACLTLIKAEELEFHFAFPAELWQIEQGGVPLNIILGSPTNQFGGKEIDFMVTAQALQEPVQKGEEAGMVFRAGKNFDRRRKEWIMVENRDKSRSICKIAKKQKVKVLGEHYCNVTLSESNLMELEKCSGCGMNALEGKKKSIEGNCIIQVSQDQILGTLPRSYLKGETRILDLEQERIAGKFKMELPTSYPGKSPFHSLSPLEGLELELLKKQNFNESLETVLWKSLVRNLESGEKELYFYTDGSLQLQSMGRSNSMTVIGLGWLQLSNDKSYIVDKGYAKVRDWPSSTRPELAAIWLVILLAPIGAKVSVFSDSLAAIEAIDNDNRLLAYSQFIKIDNFSIVNKIRDIVGLKEITLDVVKVKGKLDGGTFTSSYSWYDFEVEAVLIEGPARHFLKLVLNVKTEAKLRNTKTFKKIEPQASESKFCWNLLWENLREISRVWCNAIYKSKKLCTFWKCLQGKLPVLLELGARFLMLYSNTTCKLCNSDEVEEQSYLARCDDIEHK